MSPVPISGPLVVTMKLDPTGRAAVEAVLAGVAEVAYLVDVSDAGRAGVLRSAGTVLARHTGQELHRDEASLIAQARLLQFVTAGIDFIPLGHFPETLPIAANGGAYPPDLSLIVKAREGGANYIYSMLSGYAEPPADLKKPDTLYYNPYFAGHLIAMPPPLTEGGVQYADGTKATVDQLAYDVTNFLTWASSPKLESQRSTGLKVMLFLIVLTGLVIAVKKKIWAAVH